jgi:hypothetical protein
MWYFIIKASPKPDTTLAKEAGGAYINCWINFLIDDGAEHLAKFYVEKAGWHPEETQDARWVVREDYEDDAETLQFFLEAEANGASLLINQWDINGEDEGE